MPTHSISCRSFDVNSIRLPIDFLTATAGNVPVEFNMHLGTAEFAKILHKVLVRMVELRDELFKQADELGEDFTEDLLQRMQEDARAQVLGEVQVTCARGISCPDARALRPRLSAPYCTPRSSWPPSTSARTSRRRRLRARSSRSTGTAAT